MREVVIVSAARTAIGRYGGALADIPASELGVAVVKEVMKRAHIRPEEIDELIMGQVLQAGCGPNPARQVLLKSGIPFSVPAYSVNKVCASGMKAVTLAVSSIASGENEIIIAGGMENMSAAPFVLSKARWGYRLGNDKLLDCILQDALVDTQINCHMGVTAENLAQEFSISRIDQDTFAARSQQKAAEARQAGKFDKEIVSVQVPREKGESRSFSSDEFIRAETTPEILANLKPAFKKDGTVTAGNASGINDGAAAMALMASDEAARRGIRPMAKIVSYTSVGVEPARMGMGPVQATKKALAKAGLTINDIDIVELNEAFAAQSLAVIESLNLKQEKVNINGGAIALGHPVGASGARILVTLIHAMIDRKAQLGLATLCVGGGQGMAIIVEIYLS